MKVLHADLVEGAYHAALQKSPIAVNRAGVDIATYPFMGAVVHLLVIAVLETSRHRSVRLASIGVDRIGVYRNVDALRQVSGRYALADFDSIKLKKYIEHDLNLLRKILALVRPITPDKDAKLQKFKSVLKKMPLKEGKRLIFTQYADTANYLLQRR